jgi:CAAX protease family protein
MDPEPTAVPPLLPPESGAGSPYSEPACGRPWGFWATIGWTFLIMLGWFLAQAAVLLGYIAIKGGDSKSMSLEELDADGLLTSLGTISAALVGVGLCILFAWLRKGIRVSDYLDLRWPRWRTIVSWIFVFIAFGMVIDLLTTLVFKRPLVPEVMVELYRNARPLPLLWVAMVIAAPFAEEFIFRGFLLTGLRGGQPSRSRDLAGVAGTSAGWAAIHVQYDFFGVAVIFFFGLLLGYARIRSGSLYLCILLHALMNLIATVEVAWFMV